MLFYNYIHSECTDFLGAESEVIRLLFHAAHEVDEISK